MRKFMNPDEAGYKLNPRFLEAFDFVEQKIRQGVFKFEVPYGYTQHVVEIANALRNSGWILGEFKENKTTIWTIKPQ